MRLVALVLLIFASPSFAATEPPVAPAAESQDAHVDFWIRTLKSHPLKLVRKSAARNLGKLGNREAVPALVAALKDQFPGVRVEAAKALGYLGDERAFAPLYDVISSAGDRELKRAANDSIDKLKAYQEYMKKKDEKEKQQLGAQPK